jgi:hypothetical protein
MKKIISTWWAVIIVPYQRPMHNRRSGRCRGEAAAAGAHRSSRRRKLEVSAPAIAAALAPPAIAASTPAIARAAPA